MTRPCPTAVTHAQVLNNYWEIIPAAATATFVAKLTGGCTGMRGLLRALCQAPALQRQPLISKWHTLARVCVFPCARLCARACECACVNVCVGVALPARSPNGGEGQVLSNDWISTRSLCNQLPSDHMQIRPGSPAQIMTKVSALSCVTGVPCDWNQLGTSSPAVRCRTNSPPSKSMTRDSRDAGCGTDCLLRCRCPVAVECAGLQPWRPSLGNHLAHPHVWHALGICTTAALHAMHSVCCGPPL